MIYSDTELSDIFKQLIDIGAQLDRWKLEDDLKIPYKLK